MQCAACHTPLAEHMNFCPLCASPVPPSAQAADPVRRVLEREVGAHFELVRLLGRGGMGAVYLARERGLERYVAIKVLSPDVAVTAQARERFRREARTAARLTHQNILPLHSFGEVGDLAYLVMDYVRGESLADRLDREGRLPSEVARRILSELADALDYAHRHGVIHRDIKPENVLMEDESGRAILADFGIAKALDPGASLTQTGVVIGTLQYMSPEQAAGDRAIDGRSDIYSLGVLGYVMLTGRALFEGRSFRDVLVKQATQEPPPLHVVLAGVPDDLVSAIARCLANDPEARWPDGRSLRLALTPDGSSDVGLPDELRDLPGFGLWAALWALVWAAIAAREVAGGGDPTLIVIIGLLVPVGFLLLSWNVFRSGFRSMQILRVACWPPKWWGLWWPRPLRRAGDMWSCLPRSARVTRSTLTAFFLAMPALLFAGKWWLSSSLASGSRQAVARHWFGVAEYGVALLTAIVGSGSAVLWRRRGLPAADVAWLLVGPTVGTRFWGRPHISALLTRPPGQSGACARDEPQSPHDYLRSISDAAEQLTGPARALGSDAVAAARQVLSHIEALDKEIAMLARDADPVEVSRIEQKLAALDGDTTDSDEQQMRMLLESQLGLLRRLGARLDGAATHRAHRVGMLGTLSLYVANLRARTAEDSLDSGELTSNIRALCLAIEQHGAPVATDTSGLLGGTVGG
jgi:serine/threonine-protein kinase